MKIAEVSEKYGISTDTLRYYERVGLIPPVPRNGSGIRDYGDTEAKRIEFVKCMRKAGLPVEVLIEYFDLVQQGDATLAARKALLTEQRNLLLARIAELQETLELLNFKIEVHVNALLKSEPEIAWIED